MLFVVTQGTRSRPGAALRTNLKSALAKHEDNWRGRRVWLPLMGMVLGGLSPEESAEIMVSWLFGLGTQDRGEAGVLLAVDSGSDAALIERIDEPHAGGVRVAGQPWFGRGRRGR